MNTKNKTFRLLALALIVAVVTYFFDNFIYENVKNKYIGAEWRTMGRYTLLAMSSLLFARGVFGFLEDKRNTPAYGRILAGYELTSFEPVALLIQQGKYIENPKRTLTSWELKVRKSLCKMLIGFSVLAILLFAIECGLGWFGDYRTHLNFNYANPFQGVTTWGKSEVIYNVIALMEIGIQMLFVFVFMRGVIGFYHDALVWKLGKTAVLQVTAVADNSLGFAKMTNEARKE